MVHKQKKEANNIYKKKKTKQLRINVTHTHAVVKKLTLTFMSKQNPLKNYTSIQKLYWKAASSRGICSGSRFATIRSAAEWQKKTHKNRIYPKNQPRNMFARDGERERKYDVTGNENKKKQLLVIPTSPCC